MNKVKNVIHPGHEVDDAILYGDQPNPPLSATKQKPRLSGEGSHFAEHKASNGHKKDQVKGKEADVDPSKATSEAAHSTGDEGQVDTKGLTAKQKKNLKKKEKKKKKAEEAAAAVDKDTATAPISETTTGAAPTGTAAGDAATTGATAPAVHGEKPPSEELSQQQTTEPAPSLDKTAAGKETAEKDMAGPTTGISEPSLAPVAAAPLAVGGSSEPAKDAERELSPLPPATALVDEPKTGDLTSTKQAREGTAVGTTSSAASANPAIDQASTASSRAHMPGDFPSGTATPSLHESIPDKKPDAVGVSSLPSHSEETGTAIAAKDSDPSAGTARLEPKKDITSNAEDATKTLPAEQDKGGLTGKETAGIAATGAAGVTAAGVGASHLATSDDSKPSSKDARAEEQKTATSAKQPTPAGLDSDKKLGVESGGKAPAVLPERKDSLQNTEPTQKRLSGQDVPQLTPPTKGRDLPPVDKSTGATTTPVAVSSNFAEQIPEVPEGAPKQNELNAGRDTAIAGGAALAGVDAGATGAATEGKIESMERPTEAAQQGQQVEQPPVSAPGAKQEQAKSDEPEDKAVDKQQKDAKPKKEKKEGFFAKLLRKVKGKENTLEERRA